VTQVSSSRSNTRLRHDFGLIIVAIKKNTGQMVFNPPPGGTAG